MVFHMPTFYPKKIELKTNNKDYIIIGIISVSVGLILTAAPIPVMWIWYMWIGFQVQNDHSGYHFPMMYSPEFHDYHHLK